MEDGFQDMSTAPRSGAVFVGMSVAGNTFDAKWMDTHLGEFTGVEHPAGWCDALTLEPVDLMGWQPIEPVTEAGPSAAG